MNQGAVIRMRTFEPFLSVRPLSSLNFLAARTWAPRRTRGLLRYLANGQG